MKHIIHTCSSALVRPNGIVRYINCALDARRDCKQTFVSDSKPTQHINTADIVYVNEHSSYTPNFVNGLPNLQVEQSVIDTIAQLAEGVLANDWHKVIAHDLMSFLAFERVIPKTRHKDLLFVQHESDINNYPERYSYLSDAYLKLQVDTLARTHATVAVPVWRKSTVVNAARNTKFLPVPFAPVRKEDYARIKTHDVLYMGDASDRKNAREFMRLVTENNLKGLVITHEPDAELFKGVDVHTFGLDQRDEMYNTMNTARVAYIPSKNECPGLVVLECLQFMPVILCKEYAWTQETIVFGGRPRSNPDMVIKRKLNNPQAHNRTDLDKWCKRAQTIWQKL